MAPGLPEIGKVYGITNETTLALTLSIFLLSFAIGVSSTPLNCSHFILIHSNSKPLFLAPLSEMYGRTWVIIFISAFIFTFIILLLTFYA